MEGPFYLSLDSQEAIQKAFGQVECDPRGAWVMGQKAKIYPLYLQGVPSPAANILKQHMLSCGGDAVVGRFVITNARPQSDVLLLGTLRQYGSLPDHLERQPFGLKALAPRLLALLEQLQPKKVLWQWADRQLELEPGHTRIAGILNVTPDSFSDGGQYWDQAKAIEQGCKMAEAGADLIDLGGQSTRPGYQQISVAEELERILPVLQVLREKVKVPISVDTDKPAVAAGALAAGAHILNDESGGSAAMAAAVAGYQAPVILMHRPAERPVYGQVAFDVVADLEKMVRAYEAAGIKAKNIAVDPGLGFAKDLEENRALLAQLTALRSLGKPIMIGASRKSFIGSITGQGVAAQRLPGSLAVAIWCALHQMELVRVHDVRETAEALGMTRALLEG